MNWPLFASCATVALSVQILSLKPVTRLETLTIWLSQIGASLFISFIVSSSWPLEMVAFSVFVTPHVADVIYRAVVWLEMKRIGERDWAGDRECDCGT